MSTRPLSPSRLVAFTQCPFKPRAEAFRNSGVLSQLGLPKFEHSDDDVGGHAAAGDDFEERLLALTRRRAGMVGHSYVQLIGEQLPKRPEGGLVGAVEHTLAAMRDGIHVIAQAPLAGALDGRSWHGVADVLLRVELRAPLLGTSWRYEAVDIKLARNASAGHLVQLALYAELLDLLQGHWPVGTTQRERIGLITGGERRGDITLDVTRDITWFDRGDVAALSRRLRRSYVDKVGEAEDLAASVADATARGTPLELDLATLWGNRYPEPVSHCPNCEFREGCASRREADRHSSLVAGLYPQQRHALKACGVSGSAPLGELAIPDVATLGGDDEEAAAEIDRIVKKAHLDAGGGLSVSTLHRARRQANLQQRAYEEQAGRYELVSHDEYSDPELRGFARLPEPSRFDVFLDLEGYPNGGIAELEGDEDDPTVSPAPGLEYLWGITTVDRLDPSLNWRDVTEPEPPDDTSALAHSEYLTGEPPDPARQARWDAWWAHDPGDEKLAMRRVLERCGQARADAEAAGEPPAHIYHYGHYEVARLKELTSRYGVGETELSDLLRCGAFVDLYPTTRDVVRISSTRRSLKNFEEFYRPPRRGGIAGGVSAIVWYANYLDARASGDDAAAEGLLREIAYYNRDDCVSTWQLREWLLTLREESTGRFGAWPPLPDPAELPAPSESDAAERRRRMNAVADELVADIEPWPESDEQVRELPEQQRVRWLMAGLLRFHIIERNNMWWDYFDRRGSDLDELYANTAAITGLQLMEGPAFDEKGCLRATYSFERQPLRERELNSLETVAAPHVRFDSELDEATRTLRVAVTASAIERHAETHDREAIVALFAAPDAFHARADSISTDVLEGRLLEIGEQLLAGSIDDRLVADVLQRAMPRAGQGNGSALTDPADDDDVVAQLCRRSAALDDSYLAVQGPPGTGKTFASARMICRLVAEARKRDEAGQPWQRIGVTGPSHAVIDNLLEGIAEAWRELYPDEAPVRIIRKTTSQTPEQCRELCERLQARGAYAITNSRPGQVETWARGPVPTNKVHKGPFEIVAGTAWLFARPQFNDTLGEVTDTPKALSHLFVDEAGQTTMAQTLPMLFATDNVVLVGDPQQLPQVTIGTHAAGVNVSALRHVMGDVDTVAPERGVLLGRTRRMHPKICSFVSDSSYQGLLEPWQTSDCDTGCQTVHGASDVVGTDAGPVWLAVDHETCSTDSEQEAQAISDAVKRLIGLEAVNEKGETYVLSADDILVIAPYNDQVDKLTKTLAQHMVTRIGTVDKFQGREAPIAFFSLTSSNRERAPRGLGFLLDKQRMNVAVSRARALAIVVGSPGLLASKPGTVENFQRLNALATFIEHAAVAPRPKVPGP